MANVKPKVSTAISGHLAKARKVIEELEDQAIQVVDSGTLDDETELVERDIAGASRKFLNGTASDKLGKPKKAKSRGIDPKLEDGWVTLRFRITPAQRNVIAAAMERARELSTGTIGGKLWKGVALEYVAAEFLSGNGYPANIPDATYVGHPDDVVSP